jgi:hypothetical protein
VIRHHDYKSHIADLNYIVHYSIVENQFRANSEDNRLQVEMSRSKLSNIVKEKEFEVVNLLNMP